MIPATINPLTHLPSANVQKRRVAGYARVSTDSDEQFTSYEAQVDYYTKYIKANPEWEFVRVYADEGISAVSTKRRDGFREMIADALDGKIDLIVTKSVSRFARNTVDSLVTIRKLKEHGVECYFEKEGIYTFDGKGELLITIMSSLAQEESRSISENVTWGQRKSFSDGKVHLAYTRFLGYEKGEDGRPAVVEEEAAVVRLIYRLFLEGKTPTGISGYLESLQIPSPGGSSRWSKTTIMSILQNEKYKGDALLQKSFTVDFLQKKLKRNEGEVPQYAVAGGIPEEIRGSHTAIRNSRRRAGTPAGSPHPANPAGQSNGKLHPHTEEAAGAAYRVGRYDMDGDGRESHHPKRRANHICFLQWHTNQGRGIICCQYEKVSGRAITHLPILFLKKQQDSRISFQIRPPAVCFFSLYPMAEVMITSSVCYSVISISEVLYFGFKWAD